MEQVIKEGALKLLTSEATCDVVLSCAGHRLKAHKVILSIASPLLQTILLEETSTPALIVLPEVETSTMTLLLDYIYTGRVQVPQEKIKDFLDAASLLKIHIYDEIMLKLKFLNCLDIKDFSSKIDKKSIQTKIEEKPLKKALRKVPNLLPISTVRMKRTTTAYKGHVIPSPWCPRIGAPLIGDPRHDPVLTKIHKEFQDLNDTNNNNFQVVNYANKKSGFIRSEIGQSETGEEISNENEEVLKINENMSKHNEEASSVNKKIEDDSIKIIDEEINPKENDFNRCESKNQKSFKPFKCEECGKCFSQLRNYKYHRSIHEGTKEFSARCPECGKTFNDKGYLSSHMKIHRDRKEYGCPHCPKRFNQRVAYNMHLRIHTGVKPHECTICGKTFSRKMLLKQHQRVHTGERPYSCPECGKTFADRSNMSLHARLHTGVKPYSCNLCSKSFTKKHHLKTHMNFHTGLKPYSCQNCGLSFSQSSNMRTHYKKCILKSPENENSQ
ncbi:zinc finger protein 3-like [Onthophagus taurus]|uniref:zinc finger protein 3-like n=1 Tax=Onthophagus taurus TaxID=166361 RepID=UPI0039BE2331